MARGGAHFFASRLGGLLLAVSLGLTACAKHPSPTPAEPATNLATPRLNNALPSPSSAAAVSSSSVAEAPTPPQLSETGAAETVDTTTTSQPLALKITQIEAPPPPGPQWKEGVNYRVLVPAQPTSIQPGQVEVIEAFWYGCPHCSALDPAVETWRKQSKANYVAFTRLPVMWGTLQRIHARVFYTAELLGKLDELHGPIFSALHDNRDALTTPEQIAAFFTAHGVSAADFQRAFSSPAVEASLKRAMDLGLRYGIQSVPTFIVNGKYVTDVGMAGGPQQLLMLVNDLAAREKGT